MTHRTGFHDGRLGIGLKINGGGDGTGKPRYPLDVNGDIRLSGAIVDSSGNPIQMMAQQRTFPKAITTVEKQDIGDGTVFGAGTFKLNGSDTYYTDGNVGIGTSTPQVKLDVKGDVSVGRNILYGIERKIKATDVSSDDKFGQSVDVDGNNIIISTWKGDSPTQTNTGTVYIFNAQTGEQIHKLITPSDVYPSEYFGYDVAISGNYAIVGATGIDSAKGAAYVFNVTTGLQIYKLIASDRLNNHSARFGMGVAISGNYAIVGAPYTEENNTNYWGKAYIYDLTNGSEVHILTANDRAEGDQFGNSVAISGNYAIVSSHRDDDGGNSTGSVYTFDVTTGNQLNKMVATDPSDNVWFGWSVAMDGNYAVIGAIYGYNNNNVKTGSAYIFDVTTGTQIHKLVAEDGLVNDEFGFNVAISGNYAMVGAWKDDDDGNDSGSAYLFNVTTGTQIKKFRPNDLEANDWFGQSVAISPNYVVIAAEKEDDSIMGADTGAVYIYSSSQNNILQINNNNSNVIVDGNVGIGTTSPDAKLHVNATSTLGICSMGDYTDFNYILNGPRPGKSKGDGAVLYITSENSESHEEDSTFTIRNDSGPIRLGKNNSKTTIEGNNIILNSNVGIGTTTPNYLGSSEPTPNSTNFPYLSKPGIGATAAIKLDVRGSIELSSENPESPDSGAYAPNIYFPANNADQVSGLIWRNYHSGSSWPNNPDIKGGILFEPHKGGYGFASGGLGFYTSYYNSGNSSYNSANEVTATCKMTIRGSGNVGIGTTNPQSRLQLGDFTGTPHITLAGANSNTASSGIYFTDNDEGANPINYGMGIQFDSQNNILNIIGDENGDGTTDKWMTIKRQNGYVGIGTTSPYSNLHINKGTGGTTWNTNFKPTDCHLYLGGYEWGGVGTTLKFGFGYIDRIAGNIPCYMGARIEDPGTDGEHAIVFGTRNSSSDTVVPEERMCISHDGNVGIGTTNPGSLLQVGTADGSIVSDGIIRFAKSSGNNSSARWGHLGYDSGYNFGWGDTTNEKQFKIAYGAPANSLVIKSDGNVGIGTTSPDALLDVNGHGWCRTLCAGSYSTFSDIDGGDGVKLQIGSSGYNSTFGIEFSGYTNSNRGENQALAKILCKSYDSNHGENHIIVFKVRGWEPQFNSQQPLNERFWFYGWGGATATSWHATSDDRVKHNERNITNAMNIINKLNAKLYFKSNDIKEHNYNYDLDNSGNPITDEYYRLEAGFIAQEVREIPELKYCVEGKEYVDDFENCFKKDASGNNIFDENNEPVLIPEHLGTIPKKLSLSYNDIFVYNVVATQELDKKVNVLESENAELKTKNTELENKVATLESTLETVLARLTALENTSTK